MKRAKLAALRRHARMMMRPRSSVSPLRVHAMKVAGVDHRRARSTRDASRRTCGCASAVAGCNIDTTRESSWRRAHPPLPARHRCRGPWPRRVGRSCRGGADRCVGSWGRREKRTRRTAHCARVALTIPNPDVGGGSRATCHRAQCFGVSPLRGRSRHGTTAGTPTVRAGCDVRLSPQQSIRHPDRPRHTTRADRSHSPMGGPPAADCRGRPARLSHLPRRDAPRHLHHADVGDRPDPHPPPHPRGTRGPRWRAEPANDAGPRESKHRTHPTPVSSPV